MLPSIFLGTPRVDTLLSELTHELDTMTKTHRNDQDKPPVAAKKKRGVLDYYSVALLGCPQGGLITGVDESDKELGLSADALRVNEGVVLRVVGRAALPKSSWFRRC